MILHLGGVEARRIHEHVRRAYPAEGCGVLLGRVDGDVRRVLRAFLAENRSEEDRPDRYRIDPGDLLVADREGREAGLDMVGFFHSHPDRAPTPSAVDLDRAWPYYVYVIVGLEKGRVGETRAWRLAADRSRFEPVELRTDAAGPHRGAAGAEEVQ